MSLQLEIAITIALGFLIGLTNEYRIQKGAKIFLGLRSALFLTLFGFIVAYLFSMYDNIALIIAGLVSAIAMGTAVYIAKSFRYSPTATTFFSTPVIFLVGLLAGLDHLFVAVMLGILTIAILFYKRQMIHMIKTITPGELIAAINVLVFGLLILLFLPNENVFYGFNPFQFWLLVLIVSFIFFIQFVIIKRIKKGNLFIFALIGSTVSSTSTAYAISKLAKRAKKEIVAINTFVTNSTMLIFQVILPLLFYDEGITYTLKLLVVAIIGLIVSLFIGNSKKEKVEMRSPFPFSSAIEFAFLLFLIMFLGSYVSKVYPSALVLVAILGGAANLLATTITFAHLFSIGNTVYLLISVSILTAILEKIALALVSKDRYFISRTFLYSLIYAFLTIALILV